MPPGLRAVQAAIDRLIDKPTSLTVAERDYLNVLGTLVYEYEERTAPIVELRGVALLRELMNERGLKQTDLVPVFRTESIVSAVLRGRRSLSKRHIQELGRFFHTSPAVFFDDSGQTTSPAA